MKEEININSNKTDEKTESYRDRSGKFKKGNPGGPGRGKKANAIDLTNLTDAEFWDGVKAMNRQDLMSEDTMVRQRAMKLEDMMEDYLRKKRAEGKVEEILSPTMLECLKVLNLAKNSFGGVESLRKWLEESLKACSGCPKFPGEANNEFQFYKGGADG